MVSSTLVDLVALATRRELIAWSHTGGDNYEGYFGMYFLRLHWLYWYGPEGITLGRQGAVLSCDNVDVVCLCGTECFSAMALLLSLIEKKWQDFSDGVSHDCARIMSDNLSGQKQSADLECEAFLERLHFASMSGKLKWVPSADEKRVYLADTVECDLEIKFLNPADYDEKPLQDLVVQLSLPKATILYACGTKGYFVIEDMLSYSVPEIKEKRDRLHFAIKDNISVITNMLAKSGSD